MKPSVILTFVLVLTVLPALSFSDERRMMPLERFPVVRQYQSINIFGTRSGDKMVDAKIEPFTKVFVGAGARVNWYNLSDTPIRIRFGTGKECKDISKAPIESFYWRIHQECYITERLMPKQGFARVTFDEKDTYKYEVQFEGTNSTIAGELIVD